MDDYGIKPEWREAWKECAYTIARTREAWKVHDLSVHLLAGWMDSEFRREHAVRAGWDGARECLWCDVCGYDFDLGGLEPRHNYTHDDWLAEARKELSRCQ